MKSKTNLYLAVVAVALLSWWLGAWILLLGFALGYYGQKALSTAIIGGVGQVTLTYMALSQNLFAFVFVGVLGAGFVIIGGFVLGALEALVGWWLARWVKK
ncbi:MAG: hypothetical protein KGI38_11820 [Thaumarchaeota archaeon]|nr:hypothetical protein [Nitrososphaerota archaeon]